MRELRGRVSYSPRALAALRALRASRVCACWAICCVHRAVCASYARGASVLMLLGAALRASSASVLRPRLDIGRTCSAVGRARAAPAARGARVAPLHVLSELLEDRCACCPSRMGRASMRARADQIAGWFFDNISAGGNLGLARNPKRCKVGRSPPSGAGWEVCAGRQASPAAQHYDLHFSGSRETLNPKP